MAAASAGSVKFLMASFLNGAMRVERAGHVAGFPRRGPEPSCQLDAPRPCDYSASGPLAARARITAI